MNSITAEWIQKAEADFATVERECRARKNPNFDGACFHAQQCAEKYLKARLCMAEITVQKTHDLIALLEQVVAVEPAWDLFREDLSFLVDFAVAYRYPGESSDRESALDARRLCRRFRKVARQSLKLS